MGIVIYMTNAVCYILQREVLDRCKMPTRISNVLIFLADNSFSQI
jgi:hypothetical protein